MADYRPVVAGFAIANRRRFNVYQTVRVVRDPRSSRAVGGREASGPAGVAGGDGVHAFGPAEFVKPCSP